MHATLVPSWKTLAMHRRVSTDTFLPCLLFTRILTSDMRDMPPRSQCFCHPAHPGHTENIFALSGPRGQRLSWKPCNNKSASTDHLPCPFHCILAIRATRTETAIHTFPSRLTASFSPDDSTVAASLPITVPPTHMARQPELRLLLGAVLLSYQRLPFTPSPTYLAPKRNTKLLLFQLASSRIFVP